MASKIILEHLKRWEGLRLTAYPDPGSRDGQPFTIGYGHTSDAVMHVSEGMTISKAEAEAVLLHDAEQAAAIVDRFVLVPLNENQRAALVSFVFNVGGAAFTASTLLRKLNAGDYDAVPGELARWIYNDGKRLAGLVNRRASEAGLWSSGAFVASANVAASVPPFRDPIARRLFDFAVSFIVRRLSARSV